MRPKRGSAAALAGATARGKTKAGTQSYRTRKGAGSPANDAAYPDPRPQRIKFKPDGFSLLGDIPALVASLPRVQYDRAIPGSRLVDLDEDGKDEALEQIGHSVFTVCRLIKLISKLLANQDASRFPLDTDDMHELGFALHGLAHMAEELSESGWRVAEARPVERPGAEARHG